ncbi:MAG TPA: DoxX family membrane protein [Spirillospora sp.]
MRPFTTLARPFVAAPYIMTGLDAIRDPRDRAERVGPAVKPLADRIEWLPKDPETLVRMEGALSLGTGALLLTGRFRRLTSLLLAAQLVPALATEHRFWTEDDPERRANERSHLLKNAGLFGALLMVAAEPRRPPRMAEVRRATRETQIRRNAEAKAIRKEAAAALREARREAARQVRIARAEGRRRAAEQAAKAAKGAKAAKAAGAAKTGGALTFGKAAGRTSGALKGLKPKGLKGKELKGKGLKGKGRAKGLKLKPGPAGLKLKGPKGRGSTPKGLRAGGAKAATALTQGLTPGRASRPGRAARTGRAVKAGTTAQAARAVKVGRTVRAGTAVQAGRVRQAVRR